jgi:hypothetical protein
VSRRAIPYTAVGPQPGVAAPPIGVAPTLATRTHYGFGAFRGLVEWGTKRGRVGINKPYPGQGAVFPAFADTYPPSKVAPDLITPALLVALNYYSPASHHNELEAYVPPQATSPEIYRRPPQTQSGRPSGPYTIEAPINTIWWPTSQQWLANAVRAGQIGQPPSGWASQRIPSQ